MTDSDAHSQQQVLAKSVTKSLENLLNIFATEHSAELSKKLEQILADNSEIIYNFFKPYYSNPAELFNYAENPKVGILNGKTPKSQKRIEQFRQELLSAENAESFIAVLRKYIEDIRNAHRIYENFATFTSVWKQADLRARNHGRAIGNAYGISGISKESWDNADALYEDLTQNAKRLLFVGNTEVDQDIETINGILEATSLSEKYDFYDFSTLARLHHENISMICSYRTEFVKLMNLLNDEDKEPCIRNAAKLASRLDRFESFEKSLSLIPNEWLKYPIIKAFATDERYTVLQAAKDLSDAIEQVEPRTAVEMLLSDEVTFVGKKMAVSKDAPPGFLEMLKYKIKTQYVSVNFVSSNEMYEIITSNSKLKTDLALVMKTKGQVSL